MEILLLDPTLRQFRISYEWLLTSSLECIRHLAIAMAAGGRQQCSSACMHALHHSWPTHSSAHSHGHFTASPAHEMELDEPYKDTGTGMMHWKLWRARTMYKYVAQGQPT